MNQRLILVGFALCVGTYGCGDSTEGMGGGAGGTGGAGQGGSSGTGGEGGGIGGTAGSGGSAGTGGAGGDPGPSFTSTRDWTDAELAHQLTRCDCQPPAEEISQSACLAFADNLPFSDRQNECFDEIILNEEFMTLENRFDCLIEVDEMAIECRDAVLDCNAGAIAECDSMRQEALASCPTPQAEVIPLTAECLNTTPEDGVDAFLDSRSARCDCLTSCTPAEPDPAVVACMVETLELEVGALGPDGPDELKCITLFWRQNAVCFGNEEMCDGAETACSDLPPLVCQISGTVLDDCLLN